MINCIIVGSPAVYFASISQNSALLVEDYRERADLSLAHNAPWLYIILAISEKVIHSQLLLQGLIILYL